MAKDILKLLIVEDKDRQINLYKDSIEEFNSGSTDVEIIEDVVKTLIEAQKKIKEKNFDAAIIDLKLRNDSLEIEGEIIIKDIKAKLRFPIYVMSNVPNDLDPSLQEQSTFYKIYNSTEKENSELLKEIYNIYKTGITKILGGSGLIDTHLQNIFWKHINPIINTWKDEDSLGEKILSRHIINYLYEYLQLDGVGNFDNYHSEEVYIVPPIRTKKHTGDILKMGEDFFIILSPACDMACNKAIPVTIVNIEKLDMPYMQKQIDIIKKTTSEPEKIKVAKEKFDSLLSNRDSFKYYFLPPSSQFRGGFINFQKISSHELSDLDTKFNVEGRITESFLKDIISRFSNYYSRQGQPDFDLKKIKDNLLK